jgi:hypothetical protein
MRMEKPFNFATWVLLLVVNMTVPQLGASEQVEPDKVIRVRTPRNSWLHSYPRIADCTFACYAETMLSTTP